MELWMIGMWHHFIHKEAEISFYRLSMKKCVPLLSQQEYAIRTQSSIIGLQGKSIMTRWLNDNILTASEQMSQSLQV
jgi:hypothetical protein